jgi:hypothetical protein
MEGVGHIESDGAERYGNGRNVHLQLYSGLKNTVAMKSPNYLPERNVYLLGKINTVA